MEFQNQTAIVTGAGSGMGRLTSERLAEEGANVVVVEVNPEAAETVVAGIRERGGTAIASVTDVRDYSQVQAAVALALDTYGSVELLINCAGGASARVWGRSEGFTDLDIEIIDWGIDVNFRAPIYFARAVLGHMIERRKGVIINMGSVEGVTGSGAAEYGASKAGLMGLTRSLALLGAPHGVRSCCVSPGPVLTRPAMANMKTRLGRAAEPAEIVDLILYLCSDKAAFITGQNYTIDGGRSIGGMG
ncbi:SDR family oxidoreductase [bacterium]|nr:SDR family oxidoreductase [bacterium]